MSALNTTPPRPIDSSTLETRSDQEIVDYTLSVWAARDFARALCETGACRYRGAPAGPCLIGRILADSCYEEGFEGEGIRHIIYDLIPHASPRRVGFLSDLQSLHDRRWGGSESDLQVLRRALRRFEADYQVIVPPAVYARLDQLIQERSNDKAL